VVIEEAPSRRVPLNVTFHPSAYWTVQQYREVFAFEPSYRYLMHDRDRIFSSALERSIENLGLTALKTPYRSPMANGLCEPLFGSMRRECLDFMILLSERHSRYLLGFFDSDGAS
jgi:transposase InsO family protein